MIIAFLLLAAFLCFVLAALGAQTRINLVALGLACWVFTQLIPYIVRR